MNELYNMKAYVRSAATEFLLLWLETKEGDLLPGSPISKGDAIIDDFILVTCSFFGKTVEIPDFWHNEDDQMASFKKFTGLP